VSREISDLCEISDLLLIFSYFDSQNKEISLEITFLMCVVEIKIFWLDVRYPQQAIAREKL